MAHRKSILLQVGLLMFCFLFQVDARAVTRNIHIPTVIRMDPPSICSLSSLDPAVKCACFAYEPFYSSKERWHSIRDFCQDELSGSIQSGERYCQSSAYGDGVGSSIPRRSLRQLRNRAAQFFRDASHQCVPTETPTPLPRSSGSKVPADAKRKLEEFTSLLARHKRTRSGSRILVATDDGRSSFTDKEMMGGAYVHTSQTSMESTSVSRKGDIAKSGKRKLMDFITVCIYYMQKKDKRNNA